MTVHGEQRPQPLLTAPYQLLIEQKNPAGKK
jgi:hypothetical protein